MQPFNNYTTKLFFLHSLQLERSGGDCLLLLVTNLSKQVMESLAWLRLTRLLDFKC